MSWTHTYVGLPYADLGRGAEGVDCWGLPRLVYKDVLDIELPSYTGDYACASERAELDALISAENVGPVWHPVDVVQPFDLALFRLGQFACHIGIVVDRSVMLHMAHGQQAKIEAWDGPRWSARRVGIYRHQAMQEGVPS